jgi:hypothetical protein
MEGGENMELAQAIDVVPESQSTVSTLGITPEMLILSLIVVIAIALLIWVAARYSERNRYNDRATYQGVKGGKVKRTITEYEDDDSI